MDIRILRLEAIKLLNLGDSSRQDAKLAVELLENIQERFWGFDHREKIDNIFGEKANIYSKCLFYFINNCREKKCKKKIFLKFEWRICKRKSRFFRL